MAGLTARIEVANGWQVIRLSGLLHEGLEVVLSPLLKSAGANCIFDFGQVTSVNSSGIAEWIEFRGKFDKNRVVMLQACPPAVVTALNLMTAFIGQARVRSVYLPMVCVKCSGAASLHIELKTPFATDQVRTLKASCPKCGNAMEPQVDVEDYFAFAS